jgi:putative N6-adenine-specific DNA methylase
VSLLNFNSLSNLKFNIRKAGLENNIDLVNKDFAVFDPPENYGIIITNPPYGERLTKEDINEFYKSIGNTLKTRYKNFTAWILTSNLEAIKYLGLHPSKKIKLMNAALECTFNRYDIYEGSKKSR